MNRKTLILLVIMLLLNIIPVSLTAISNMLDGDYGLAVWKLLSVYWALVALSYYERLEDKCNNT